MSVIIDIPIQQACEDSNTNFLPNSPYIPQSCLDGPGGVKIYRYFLSDTSEDAISKAAKAILELLDKRWDLSPLFPIMPEALQKDVRDKAYLTINDIAVCLSDRPAAGNNVHRTKFKDHFSGGLLEEPVKCEKGHYLERKTAEFWKERKGSFCPVDYSSMDRHSLNDLTIDKDLQEEIQQFLAVEADKARILKENTELKKLFFSARDNLNEKDIALKQAEEEKKYLRTANDAASKELCEQSKKLAMENANSIPMEIRPFNQNLPMVMEVAKILVKAGGLVCENVCKIIVSESGKLIGKTISAKVIPGWSLFIGGYGAISRWERGERILSVFEVASSGAAIVPVVGTFLSVGIDLGLLINDFYKNKASVKEPIKVQSNITLDEAFRLLDISQSLFDGMKEETKKETLKNKYNELLRIVHTDKYVKTANGLVISANSYTQLLIAAQKLISANIAKK